MVDTYSYDRSARIKTAMRGSLWAGIGEVLEAFTEKLANDLVGHLPQGWRVQSVLGGAMNQISASARFSNGQGDEIGMALYLGKDLHVEGHAALQLGQGAKFESPSAPRTLRSNLKIKFDSFSSPEVVARDVGAELNKLFAADATFTRLV
jgi:hypothetical protein